MTGREKALVFWLILTALAIGEMIGHYGAMNQAPAHIGQS